MCDVKVKPNKKPINSQNFPQSSLPFTITSLIYIISKFSGYLCKYKNILYI